MKKLFSHLIFVKIIEFRSFLENRPETADQFPPLLLRGSAGLQSLGYWSCWWRMGCPAQKKPENIGVGGHMGCGWQPWDTWLCRKGEHKVVRKALNSSSTYKTDFYKDPSSLVPNWGEHFNVYSHALFSLWRIKVAQIKSFCYYYYICLKKEKKKRRRRRAFKIRIRKKRSKIIKLVLLAPNESKNKTVGF